MRYYFFHSFFVIKQFLALAMLTFFFILYSITDIIQTVGLVYIKEFFSKKIGRYKERSLIFTFQCLWAGYSPIIRYYVFVLLG